MSDAFQSSMVGTLRRAQLVPDDESADRQFNRTDGLSVRYGLIAVMQINDLLLPT